MSECIRSLEHGFSSGEKVITMVVFGGKNSNEKYFPSLGRAAILFVIFSIIYLLRFEKDDV